MPNINYGAFAQTSHNKIPRSLIGDSQVIENEPLNEPLSEPLSEPIDKPINMLNNPINRHLNEMNSPINRHLNEIDEPLNEPLSEPLSEPLNEPLVIISDKEKLVYLVITENPMFNKMQITKMTEISRSSVDRSLKNLLNLGMIEKKGERKSVGYIARKLK